MKMKQRFMDSTTVLHNHENEQLLTKTSSGNVITQEYNRDRVNKRHIGLRTVVQLVI